MAKKHAEFQVFKTKNKLWSFRLRSKNGKIQTQSQQYKSKLGALKGLDDFLDAVFEAESVGIVIQEGK